MRVYLRVAKRLATEPHLPKPLRALLVFALLPIPGPIDELALFIAAVTIAVFYRPRFRALLEEERSRTEQPTDDLEAGEGGGLTQVASD